MKKYAKWIDEDKIEYAPAVKNGSFFNYNSELNEEMLLADGYLPLVVSAEIVSARKIKMKYRLEKDKIVAYWAEIPAGIEEIRAEKLAEVKTQYEGMRQNVAAEYNGMSFSIHETAKQNLTASVLLAQTLGGNIDYCEQDGTPHTFSLEEFKPVIQVISEAIKRLEFKYYQLESRIKTAVSIAEIEAVKWE